MNLLNEYEKAMPMAAYLEMLGDQKKLHDLHHKKAQVDEPLSDMPPLKILVITETWCGDSVAILPVLTKLFADSPVSFHVALRDKNDDLMQQFLTNGGKAIPVILVLDEQGELLLRFGPRPKKIQAIYEDHRADITAGKIEKKEVIRKIRSFYAKDRGAVIKMEFLNALNEVLKMAGRN